MLLRVTPNSRWFSGLLAAVLCVGLPLQGWSQETVAGGAVETELSEQAEPDAPEPRPFTDAGASVSEREGPFEIEPNELLTQDGLEVIDTHAQRFTVRFGAEILWDQQYGTDDGLEELGINEFENETELRSVRLSAHGEGYGIFEYKIEIDFAEFNDLVAKDIFLGLELPVGRLRIGHLKEPFSLEELIEDIDILTFTERALPNALVPGRNLGVLLSNTWGEDERGTWAIGTFMDDLADPGVDSENDGNNDHQDSENRSLTLRLTRLLLYEDDGRFLVHVGGAFRHVESDGPLTFQARPEVRQETYLLGVVTEPTNSYQQYGLEAAAVWGPASVQAEWILTDVAAAHDPLLQGGYVYVSYFLTGENRAYDKEEGTFKRLYPLENFWWVRSDNKLCNFGSGAWEIAFRYSWLDFIDDGLTSLEGGEEGTAGISGEMDAYTVGVNWYWTPHARVMFDYIHTDLHAASHGDATEDVFVTRFQLDFY